MFCRPFLVCIFLFFCISCQSSLPEKKEESWRVIGCSTDTAIDDLKIHPKYIFQNTADDRIDSQLFVPQLTLLKQGDIVIAETIRMEIYRVTGDTLIAGRTFYNYEVRVPRDQSLNRIFWSGEKFQPGDSIRVLLLPFDGQDLEMRNGRRVK